MITYEWRVLSRVQSALNGANPSMGSARRAVARSGCPKGPAHAHLFGYFVSLVAPLILCVSCWDLIWRPMDTCWCVICIEIGGGIMVTSPFGSPLVLDDDDAMTH